MPVKNVLILHQLSTKFMSRLSGLDQQLVLINLAMIIHLNKLNISPKIKPTRSLIVNGSEKISLPNFYVIGKCMKSGMIGIASL